MQTTWKWRDESVVPPSYDDLPELVALARRARGRWVDFEWSMSADELKSLRRAILEWTARITGRYRSFDARVVTAIDAALATRARRCSSIASRAPSRVATPSASRSRAATA